VYPRVPVSPVGQTVSPPVLPGARPPLVDLVSIGRNGFCRGYGFARVIPGVAPNSSGGSGKTPTVFSEAAYRSRGDSGETGKAPIPHLFPIARLCWEVIDRFGQNAHCRATHRGAKKAAGLHPGGLYLFQGAAPWSSGKLNKDRLAALCDGFDIPADVSVKAVHVGMSDVQAMWFVIRD
jgi:hypothetical protein